MWSLGTTKLPTAADRDIDFIALPYLGVDGPPVRTGPVEPADPGEPSGSHSPPGPGTEQSLQDAVALQQAVNQELMEAVRKLEATVAELTAAPPTLEAPGAPSSLRPSRERRGHAVDVLQWVEAGARPAQPPERPAAGDPRLRPGRPALRRSPRRRTHRP